MRKLKRRLILILLAMLLLSNCGRQGNDPAETGDQEQEESVNQEKGESK